jgi:hypothetical protein
LISIILINYFICNNDKKYSGSRSNCVDSFLEGAIIIKVKNALIGKWGLKHDCEVSNCCFLLETTLNLSDEIARC